MLRAAGLVIVLQLLACGDRSPPALWPEAPPPTLAAPLGIAEPSTEPAAATDVAAAEPDAAADTESTPSTDAAALPSTDEPTPTKPVAPGVTPTERPSTPATGPR